MIANDDLQQRWWNLEAKLVERFGKKPDVETILFLIGMQEFGDIKEKFTKEEIFCHFNQYWTWSAYQRK